MGKLMATLAGVALLAGACSSGESSDPSADGRSNDGTGARVAAGSWPTASFASALEPYDDCDALLEDLQARTVDLVGPYGLDSGEMAFVDDMALEAVEAPAAASADGAARAELDAPTTTVVDAGGSSQTNVQEEGIDEPDLVDHDGTHLYSVVDGQLRVVDVSGDAPVLRTTSDLPTTGGSPQIMLAGDRLVVVDEGYGDAVPFADDVATAGRSLPSGTPTTEVAVLDVSDPTRPRTLDHLSVDGRLLGARMVDGRARLVTTSAPHGFGFVVPQSSSAEEAAEEANRRIVEESTIEDWLPSYRRIQDGEVTAVSPVVACDAVATPGVPSGTSTVSMLTVDVAEGAIDPADTVSVVADGETVYASTGTLYVATNAQLDADLSDDPQQARGDDVVTAVHAFDISGDGPAAYLATGEVPGRLLDQFAMSEHDGVLRVATTVDDDGRSDSESYVTTLRRDGADLVELGQVGDMGRGEEIYSVRFQGDQGYVVTFRQIDPLYTLDLSDPAAPTVVGELKIPGFSTYLHPIGEGRLLGIGQDATLDGGTVGTKVSLFDVSDPAAPAEVAVWTAPGANSMAEGDHHAFLWWAPEDLLVVPLSVYGGVLDRPAIGSSEVLGGSFEGAVGLTVADGAITERGRIEHLATGGDVGCPPDALCEPVAEPLIECGPEDDCAIVEPAPPLPGSVPCDPAVCDPGPVPPPYDPTGTPIVRTVVVEGKLLTISSAGVERSAMGDLGELSWLPFG